MSGPATWLRDRDGHRRVLAIAFPAILANSSAPLVGLVDTWAVGHLPGAVHLAAVGLGGVIFNYILWAFGFLRMGTTGMVAQAHGRDDADAVARVLVRSAVLALLLGLALLVFQGPILALSLQVMAPPGDVAAITAEYFDIRIWAAPAALLVYAVTGALFGQGRTVAVLVLQLALNLGNGALNLLFVVVLDMGVPGVAWGTLLAQWGSVVVGLWLLTSNPGLGRLARALFERATWTLDRFRSLVALNGFIFIRTILLMTALAMIMRESAGFDDVGMAASHVVNQYMMLVALGLDGFAHAAEALAGAAWGERSRQAFRRWVWLAGLWAVVASLAYAALFWLFGDAITATLTNLETVRTLVARIMPMVIALPIVAVACFHFDGVFIGATAGAAMMATMAVAFAIYLAVLGPMTAAWGLVGLWGAVLVFMAARGLAQAAWYPRLLARLD
ncbi:MATE family efflux transporter [Marinihelvus fidelis]|uniref:MATE family efflux transporter n=1 Tax=Marinihelvus fidelis TaxID=2613842 RepID=UPI001784F289|nr:MATE family efflux transporter [Marinihelvus fidelis]